MIDAYGPHLALGFLIVGLAGLLAMAFMRAGSDADDSDDALVQRILDGDPRLASFGDECPQHGRGNNL